MSVRVVAPKRIFGKFGIIVPVGEIGRSFFISENSIRANVYKGFFKPCCESLLKWKVEQRLTAPAAEKAL